MLSLPLAVFLALNPAPSLSIPSKVGTTWHYKVAVAWTVMNSHHVKRRNIQWTATVVGRRSKGTTTAIVVRGFPTDLSWYEPGTSPGLSLLTITEDGLWLNSSPKGDTVDQLLDAALEREDTGEHILLSSPSVGDKIDPDDERQDAFYCWHVESPARYKGNTGWRVSYWTNPDNLTFDFIPGKGFTYFQYNHHGTVALSEARLISIVVPK